MIIDRFSEIHLDNGTVYRLKQTDDSTPIGLKKETVELINDDSNENKRYIINAEIYDIDLENFNGTIAVKYEGSNEIYYYSAVEVLVIAGPVETVVTFPGTADVTASVVTSTISKSDGIIGVLSKCFQ